jgi:predicted nucleotidyltransferase
MINVELFEGLKISNILNDVRNHIDCCIGSLPESEFQLKMFCIVGSRLNGTHTENSDLDIALSYKGSLREDDCFNELMDSECPLYIEGIKVDFIPYNLEKGNDIDFRKCYHVLISVEDEKDKVLYEEDKMKRFVEKGGHLKFVYTDLTNRNVLSSVVNDSIFTSLKYWISSLDWSLYASILLFDS